MKMAKSKTDNPWTNGRSGGKNRNLQNLRRVHKLAQSFKDL
jgi:hypothetical protein